MNNKELLPYLTKNHHNIPYTLRPSRAIPSEFYFEVFPPTGYIGNPVDLVGEYFCNKEIKRIEICGTDRCSLLLFVNG